MEEKKCECLFLSSCPFFETLSLPTSAEILKVQYCRGDYQKCTRYKLKSTGKQPSSDMWPDGSIRKSRKR